MRVICIDENAYPKDLHDMVQDYDLRTGQEHIVIDVELLDGYVWYKLEAWPTRLYWEKCFAPISDIDETEMEREIKVKELTPLNS